MTPEAEAEIQAATVEATGALTLLRNFEISSPEDTQFLATVLTDVKAKWKDLEEKRKSITGPINTALKRVNDLFAPPLTALKNAETTIKSKLAIAEAEARAKAQAALNAAAEAAAKSDTKAIAKAIAAHDVAVQTPVAAGVQYRKSWTYEITDASKLPREFLIPDHAALKAIARANAEVPGVRFFEVTTVVSR